MLAHKVATSLPTVRIVLFHACKEARPTTALLEVGGRTERQGEGELAPAGVCRLSPIRALFVTVQGAKRCGRWASGGEAGG